MNNNLKTLEDDLITKAKAEVGLAVAAAVTYIGTAITTNNVWTLHGLELAVVAGLLTGITVHQTPYKAKRKVRRSKRRAK